MTTLSMTRGDTTTFLLTITRSGSVYDLTGCSLIFTVKSSLSDLDSAALIQKKSSAGGIVISSPATLGTANVLLVPSDTSALTTLPSTYFFDVQLVDVTGAVFTVDSGTLTISADVTTSTS